MKRLSKWAKANPHKSRFIIVVARIVIVINACFLGLLTYWVDWEIPYSAAFVLANLFFVFFILYPNKKANSGIFKQTYQKQKTLDFLLVITYSLVIVGGVNYAMFNIDLSDDYISARINESPSTVILTATAPSENPTTKEEQKLHKKELKERKKIEKRKFKAQLKELKRALKKQKQEDGGVVLAKIGLIILALAATIGLGYLVAALACTVACSGGGAMGVVILIIGWGGLIWLLVFTIIKIIQNVGRKRKEGNGSY